MRLSDARPVRREGVGKVLKSNSPAPYPTEWLADLLRHGLLMPSFIPPQPIRALRELTRYRKSLAQARAQETNRLHKVLEAANIKLTAVATDVLGRSAREMLEALLSGEHDVGAIAERARTRMRPKIPELKRALQGHLQPQHRFVLRAILAHVDFLDASIAQTHAEIEARLQPYQEAVRLLQTIPGIQETAAATIIAEIGVDMSRFPTAKHLASWARLCPGNNESAGKRHSGATGHGNSWGSSRPRRITGVCSQCSLTSAAEPAEAVPVFAAAHPVS